MKAKYNKAVLKSNPEISKAQDISNLDELNNHKEIPISEFRKLGYLQEANRLFFHPLGLSLCVKVSEEGEEILSHVSDYRDGEIAFDNEISLSEEFQKRIKNIESEFKKRLQ